MLASAPISYIKWDMNRTITEPYSTALPADRQGEFFHRYVLGVYDLYARLDGGLPGRSCSSRAPAAAAGSTRACSPSRRRPGRATTPTPSSACAIQWGTSLAYPLSSMGAHVAAVPNHQTGRITPIDTRAAVAFFGVFGYELDPTDARPPTDRAAVADQIAFYKAHRELFQRGRFVRLRSPFEGDGNQTAWMVVAPDASRGDRRLLPGPQPARARRRPAAPARAGSRRASIASRAGRTSTIRCSATTPASAAATS